MYYIGVDLGGTNIAVGIVDKEGKILAKKSVKTLADRPFDEIVADMAKCILDLLAEQGMTENDIVSIGIGLSLIHIFLRALSLGLFLKKSKTDSPSCFCQNAPTENKNLFLSRKNIPPKQLSENASETAPTTR